MKVTVAAACAPDVKGDPRRNIEAAVSMIRQLAEAGARIVVLPEACLQGYALENSDLSKEPLREIAEPLDGDYARAFRTAARESDVYLVACYDRRDGERVYNSAELIGPDGASMGVYDKTHTFSGSGHGNTFCATARRTAQEP